mmetsp:Transcript_39944/g.124984  ORF Transcript_39944/g.124984 Transcript_39944/m.124984 type:complete len:273 (+) Transcript_39944:774-1592(+)
MTVLYEDEHLAAIYKPAGIPVHSGGGGDGSSGEEAKTTAYAPKKSVRTFLPSLLAPTEEVGALRRPIHVHRLDAATSGVLLAAKTQTAVRELSRAFADRNVRKRYRAVLIGVPAVLGGDGGFNATAAAAVDSSEPHVISAPVDGRASVTEWRAVNITRSLRFGYLTTVDMWPRTGRKHQLRRHAAEVLGCPILGDTKYERIPHGDEGNFGISHGMGLFLCAVELRLAHPLSGQDLCIAVGEPPKFTKTREREHRRFLDLADAGAAQDDDVEM